MGNLHKIRRAWERMSDEEKRRFLTGDGEVNRYVGAVVRRGKIRWYTYTKSHNGFIRSLVGKKSE